MQRAKNIYLIGFMGSGKTTIGKLLAQAKNRTFIDLDEYIEKKEKSSIAQLFLKYDESKFRQIETRHLKTLAKKQGLIIATGGGTPCSRINAAILKTGYVIYLKCTLRTLTDRLYREKSDRPLIAEIKTKSKLYAFIRDLMKKRQAFYRKHDLLVASKGSPELILQRILKQL